MDSSSPPPCLLKRGRGSKSNLNDVGHCDLLVDIQSNNTWMESDDSNHRSKHPRKVICIGMDEEEGFSLG